MTWTPGPWEWEYGVSERTSWALRGPDGYILRFPGPQDIDVVPNPEADMALISLAPEMAEVLAGWVQLYESRYGAPSFKDPEFITKSRDLLARARGEDA